MCRVVIGCWLLVICCVVDVGPLTSEILVRPLPAPRGAVGKVVVPSGTGRGPRRNAMITVNGKAGSRAVILTINSAILCKGCTKARVRRRNGGCLVVHRSSILTAVWGCAVPGAVLLYRGEWLSVSVPTGD